MSHSNHPTRHEERLQLRALGSITEADILVREMTVFVGPQATGKSRTAQLLYFLRGLEELVLPEFDLETYDPLNNLLEEWMGLSATDMGVSQQFNARWQSAAQDGSASLEYELSTQRCKKDDPYDLRYECNEAFWARLVGLVENGGGPDLIFEQQIYIPAGRILCSLVPPALGVSLLSRGRVHWPGYLGLFYEKLQEAIAALPSRQLPGMAKDSAYEQIDQKSKSSLRGTLSHFSNKAGITIEDRHRPGTHVTTSFGNSFASGQLETWPLWTLLSAHLTTPAIKRFYIEEPEAHLHPSAQRDVTEALAYLLRHRFRFVLTTHSPYVIYALNNALLAGKVLAAGRSLPAGVSPDSAITPAQISAYRFGTDGIVKSILDEETGLLDTTELDDPAAQLGATFSALQESLHDLGGENR